jgi:hypothetical protein
VHKLAPFPILTTSTTAQEAWPMYQWVCSK